MKATVGALLVVVSVAAAQSPQFDVASIKKNPLGGARVGVETPPGRFQATNTPLRFLIRWSYRIAEPRIIGGPGWIGVDRFDVSATASVEGWSGERTRQMVRALLADRFGLAAHMETREMPIFVLTVAKPGASGPRLQPAAFDCSAPDAPSRMIAGRVQCGLLVSQNGGSASLRGGGTTMADFARTLGEYVDRPLVDRTGLTARYDLDLQFTADRSALVGARPPGGLDATTDSDIPPLPTALREQLGLRLDSERGPVEVLVIDRVSQPAEN
ncbi:MAG TPA: TIGR03435 family protein [Vicinamibacterales bacterium]|nr:TIGR03435 family protein [Vicinamibacterales bacterium]